MPNFYMRAKRGGETGVWVDTGTYDINRAKIIASAFYRDYYGGTTIEISYLHDGRDRVVVASKPINGEKWTKHY